MTICIFLAGGGGCMKKIPYQTGQIDLFRQRQGNLELHFVTDQGKQVAFYIPPLERPEDPPARIAILYPGINSLALGWLGFVRPADDPKTGYLLIDYPGRGFCDGSMRPEQNYRNTDGALAALAEHFGGRTLTADISLMGHSFGTGAALQFALRRNVRRVVLVAPFNTMTEAVSRRSRILAWLMTDEIDNVAQVRMLLTSDEPPAIAIFHGADDEVLPVSMAREVAAVDPGRIVYYEVEGGDHSSILTSHRDLIFQALLGNDR